jgi:arylsulfatase A-like enzyme
MMRTLTVFLFLILLVSASAAPKPPNILLILADDMGYSDAGCYGGDVMTPNLDALAAGGLRYTQAYNTARCWPSRAAILTGYYAQQVRRDAFPDGKRGGQGKRPDFAQLLPVYLRTLGYRNYQSGKWHVDGNPEDNGFDHSYVMNDHDHNFAPKNHIEDGVKLPPIQEGTDYYTTTAYADHAIKCLKEHASKHADKPFFEYLAFTVPHFPLHAPQKDIEKYTAKYKVGWDVMRGERYARQKQAGMVNCPLSALERKVGPPYAFGDKLKILGPNEVNRPVPWSELNDGQQDFQAKKMAIHAAMVDVMDQNIGRVLDQLKAMKCLDDTIVLFLSDNGASAEMMVRGSGHDPEAAPGSAGSYLCLGPGWSSTANTPFRRHKTWVHEGGIATPLIVHWPAGIAAGGELRHDPTHIVDLVPTLMEAAGGKLPATQDGQPVPPRPGKSLVPSFAKDGAVTRDYLWWLHEGNRAFRVGDMKIVAAKGEPWELYDLSKDRSEMNDLSAKQPELVKKMATEWEKHTEEFKAVSK